MGTVNYPMINGHRMDFSSISFQPNGSRIIGIKSINYKHSLKPGMVRGTSAQVAGMTRGEYDASWDMEIYREDWLDFVTALAQLGGFTSGLGLSGQGPGYMEVPFPCSVAYAETPWAPVQMDMLIGCRITDDDVSNSSGSDGLTLKIQGVCIQQTRAGFSAINIPITPSGF